MPRSIRALFELVEAGAKGSATDSWAHEDLHISRQIASTHWQLKAALAAASAGLKPRRDAAAVARGERWGWKPAYTSSRKRAPSSRS